LFELVASKFGSLEYLSYICAINNAKTEQIMEFSELARSRYSCKKFPIPEDWTTNVCFGGKERNILFITASKSVYTLKMLVRGV